ncbi:MAG: SDR family NAD(P)-dependent oxidoreductase [Nevskia sp.]|nr:SDR family NAD(P)-dependent oxidoreductase [Nevskia sp.]
MLIRKGDVGLVTGASRGLGVVIAEALAARGMNLVLAARSHDDLEAVRLRLETRYRIEAIAVAVDLDDEAALAALVDAALQRFGHLDLLVNNAGVDHPLRFDAVNPADIRRVLSINLTAPMLLARLCLPHMQRAGRGHIVNIASVAGLMSSAYEELYVAAKHGLVGFTRALRLSAQELRWQVSASVICPGFMDGAGVYERMKLEHRVKAPAAMGSMSAQRLGRCVIECVERDRADAVLMRGAPRLVAALQVLLPGLYELICKWLDTSAPFRTVASANMTNQSRSQ